MHSGETVDNIILIGMPGAGKSTTGRVLAKILGMHFIDTDIVIQEKTGRLLQEIIETDGADAFKQIEETAILSLQCNNTVIATGGSAVFSRRAMEYLKSGGVVIYLSVTCGEMERRLKDITTRGIVLVAGQSLEDMFSRRIPLYEKYADVTVDCSADNGKTCAGTIINALGCRAGTYPEPDGH
jgi:shikimate kinase